MDDFAAGRAAFAAAACFLARACAARSFAAALLLLALAGLRAVLVLVAARAAVAAVRALARVGRAFAALDLLAFAAVVRDFRAARAIVALALRDFSVFLADDIRAHSFFVSPGGETQSCSKENFAARGRPRHLTRRGTAERRIIHLPQREPWPPGNCCV
ncbi:MAG: hypothetical protein ACLQL2_01980 [Methylovirgula sp.]